uniref:RE29544p n=1 Tax=Drosophila melanogaster TaxID=7227 RepID=Q8MS30_DROME|nr:RE29544p [Drosophila melanogaster]
MELRICSSYSLYKFLALCCFLTIVLFLIYSSNTSSNTNHDLYPPTTRFSRVSVKAEPQKFFVKTSKCHIPYVDPFNDEAMELYKPQTLITCSNETDLISTTYNEIIKRHILHIDDEIAQKLLNFTDKDYNCFYREIKYGKIADTYDNLKAKKYFTSGYEVPVHVEGMIVECQTADDPIVVLQKDAFAFIQHRPLPKDSIRPRAARKPSVIMYGIDSLSRINLRRTMPKVFNFLQGPGWYEMQGYNKVADNSFPNILAILSGYSASTAKENVCDTDKQGCLDEMPMIWKYFKNASYLTGYAEDESNSNHFNYLKPGFSKKPMDYYFRPLLRALESEMDVYRLPEHDYMRYCLGRRIANRYIYDYGLQFTKRFVHDRPIWGMFWSNHFSHDDPFMPSAMQEKVLGDLIDMHADGQFEEMIMIFFADHGTRFGDLTYLKEGFLEERLPMMFIYLPPWFRETYPSYVRALELNQHRLSSNFDLHNTLKHIIEIGGTPDGRELPKSFDCPTCQSLFYPLPEGRTCSEAGIEEHWCTCEPYKIISGQDWTTPIAHSVIDRMNEYFVQKNLTSLCSNLTLNYVHKTEIKTGLNIDWHQTLMESETAVYRIKFKVKQNSADFQATVVYHNSTQNAQVNVEKISRTNSYKEDSTCIDDKLAKLYCICFSDLH